MARGTMNMVLTGLILGVMVTQVFGARQANSRTYHAVATDADGNPVPGGPAGSVQDPNLLIDPVQVEGSTGGQHVATIVGMNIIAWAMAVLAFLWALRSVMVTGNANQPTIRDLAAGAAAFFSVLVLCQVGVSFPTTDPTGVFTAVAMVLVMMVVLAKATVANSVRDQSIMILTGLLLAVSGFVAFQVENRSLGRAMFGVGIVGLMVYYIVASVPGGDGAAPPFSVFAAGIVLAMLAYASATQEGMGPNAQMGTGMWGMVGGNMVE